MAPESGNRPFLDVGKSLTGKVWRERLSPVGRQDALAMAQKTGLPELLCRVLAGRGVNADDAERFLEPSIRDLMPDPSTMTDMETAAQRIAAAIIDRRRIAIFGDYDVDGAAASAMLSRFLHGFGIDHEIYIPDRIFEGYGPNEDAIDQLASRGAELLITVDCGATSFDALKHAGDLGLETIVLDHHQTEMDLPLAAAIVNPNRQDDLSGLGYLCAAGVVFMALVAIQRELRRLDKPAGINLLELLDLAALATVCDVVPLKELNRAFVMKGLQVMAARNNVGLKALARSARLDGPPTVYHLGFLLGPRINAGGRIGDAALGSRLLTLEDEATAVEIADRLESLNIERQAAENAMLEEAYAEAEAEKAGDEGPTVLVAAREGWHPGIAGLVASRLKDRYRRPAFAIALDPSGKGTGSGRSIPGADLGKAVRDAVQQGILEKGGGHAMAAGLTIRRKKLGEFRAFLEDALAKSVAESRDHLTVKIDGALTARAANMDFLELIERAGPYGAGHPQPVFAFPNHLVRDARIVGRDHVSLTLQASDGKSVRAIAFRAAGEPIGNALLDARGDRLHLAGTLSINHWQGRQTPQLRIVDAALPA